MITMITERLLKGQLKPSVTDAEDILSIMKHQDNVYHDHWKVIKESVETFSDGCRRHTKDYSDYYDHWKGIYGLFVFFCYARMANIFLGS